MTCLVCILPCIVKVLALCTRANESCSRCIDAIWRRVAFRVSIANGQWLNKTTGKIETRYLENTPYYISNQEILDIESTL